MEDGYTGIPVYHIPKQFMNSTCSLIKQFCDGKFTNIAVNVCQQVINKRGKWTSDKEALLKHGSNLAHTDHSSKQGV